MDPERWQQIERIYSRVLELEPSQRAAFIEEACLDDKSLRQEVERLLSRQSDAEHFIESPAIEMAAQALAKNSNRDIDKDLTASTLLHVGRTLLHYRIDEKIGEGGMGVVYNARDTHLDRSVALKVLPPEAVAYVERKRRFIQEAKAASALNHPNIITIYDISQADGIDFIAMEFVAGKTLDRRIGRRGLPLGEALKYGAQIADALEKAHNAGIVHRDLKPANVMVSDEGRVKVLDFGLAKLMQPLQSDLSGAGSSMQSQTDEGRIMGTVAYMSPEQAEGKHIDTRSDIFSFGSVLYEMLTGQRAFHGDTRASTIASILREEPKPISQVSEGMPREAERIVRRCLRKDPEHRFQTMADLRVALEELKEESDSGAQETPAAKAKPHRSMGIGCGRCAPDTHRRPARMVSLSPEG